MTTMLTMLPRTFRPNRYSLLRLWYFALVITAIHFGRLFFGFENSAFSTSPAPQLKVLSKALDESTELSGANSTMVEATHKQHIPVKSDALLQMLTVRNTSKTSQLSATKRSSSPSRNSPFMNASTVDCGDIKFRTRDLNLVHFKPALTGQNLCSLMATVDAFKAALDHAQITYFMYSGTLLGSWRHHGLVPWDDDVDVAVPIDHQQTVYRLLMDLKPKIVLNVKQKKRWKLFQENAHPIRGVAWKFPFLDINFYHMDSTHVWDHDVKRYYMFKYPKEWIFPLKLRPFQGRMLWSPAQPENVLRLTYSLEQCETNTFAHRKESIVPRHKRRTVSCRKLHGLLPFVRRSPVKDSCNETLEHNGQVLSYYLDRNFC